MCLFSACTALPVNHRTFSTSSSNGGGSVSNGYGRYGAGGQMPSTPTGPMMTQAAAGGGSSGFARQIDANNNNNRSPIYGQHAVWGQPNSPAGTPSYFALPNFPLC